MAAITHLRVEDEGKAAVAVRGAAARAAAVRSRGFDRRRPSLFSGDGVLRRPAPPVRLTSLPLVAHDDVAPLRVVPAAPAAPRTRVAEPGRTARPARSTTSARPSAATYRRRRIVAAAVVVAVVLAAGWVLGALGGGSLAASERPGDNGAVELPMQPVSRSTYVVERGDTLWSIARALQPEGDVRPVVDALAAQRSGRPLDVGETIVLP